MKATIRVAFLFSEPVKGIKNPIIFDQILLFL